jgi:hypothetical protein
MRPINSRHLGTGPLDDVQGSGSFICAQSPAQPPYCRERSEKPENDYAHALLNAAKMPNSLLRICFDASRVIANLANLAE